MESVTGCAVHAGCFCAQYQHHYFTGTQLLPLMSVPYYIHVVNTYTSQAMAGFGLCSRALGLEFMTS